MQIVKINRDGTLVIPKSLRSIFKPSSKVVCFAEGDTLILKKLSPSPLSEIAKRRKENPIPLEEIVEEVHSYRKEKRAT